MVRRPATRVAAFREGFPSAFLFPFVSSHHWDGIRGFRMRLECRDLGVSAGFVDASDLGRDQRSSVSGDLDERGGSHSGRDTHDAGTGTYLHGLDHAQRGR